MRRRRPVLAFFVVTFVLAIVAASVVVAVPSVLDPLCDEYEWFGDHAATVVRGYAEIAHDWIADPLRL